MDASKFYIGGGKTDVLKFAMCFLIVVLHTTSIDIISPVLRCAVPVFFMISSYFFYKKYDNAEKTEDKKSILVRYIKRNMQLYLFWLIVLLPFTVIYRGWYEGDVISIALQILKYFLFSSTFPVSWYIMASIIGVCAITILSRYINNGILFIISLLAYAFCCAASNYGNLLTGGTVGHIYSGYVEIFTSPYNSFPVSLVWIQLGRFIASRENELSRLRVSTLLVALSVAFVLLYIEYYLTRHYELVRADDCYFMLLPVCVIIILILGRYQSELPIIPFFRKTSTIVFCIHLSICLVFRFALKSLGIQSEMIVFFATLAVSMSLSYLIMKLEPKVKILRYSY